MIVCDTTVLVYAVGGDHRLREPARRLVGVIGEGVVEASTTVGVLQEFAHVRARRRTREDAVEYTRTYARLLAPLLTTRPEDLDAGLEIFRSTTGLGAFEAVLAAVVLRHAAAAFVTADLAFAGIPGFPVVQLGSPELDDLVAP